MGIVWSSSFYSRGLGRAKHCGAFHCVVHWLAGHTSLVFHAKAESSVSACCVYADSDGKTDTVVGIFGRCGASTKLPRWFCRVSAPACP